MSHPVFRFDGWTFDCGRRSLKDPTGKKVALTPLETTLLQIFLEHPQQCLSRQFLLDELYDTRPPSQRDMALYTWVRRLHAKLQDRTADTLMIRLVTGGYWFCPAPEIVSQDVV